MRKPRIIDGENNYNESFYSNCNEPQAYSKKYKSYEIIIKQYVISLNIQPKFFVISFRKLFRTLRNLCTSLISAKTDILVQALSHKLVEFVFSNHLTCNRFVTLLN